MLRIMKKDICEKKNYFKFLQKKLCLQKFKI